MKRFNYTILLTLLMCMVGETAFAHDIALENADGKTIFYNWIKNHTELSVTHLDDNVSIHFYTGKIVIPEYVTLYDETYSVTSIGSDAFAYCTSLTAIVIPNSVTSIGSSAFSGCTGLASIDIPNSVTSIGSSTFYGCTGLTSVSFHCEVTKISDNAFYGCTGLTSVSFHCKNISSLFSGFANIKEVVIGDEVTSIRNSAISGYH